MRFAAPFGKAKFNMGPFFTWEEEIRDRQSIGGYTQSFTTKSNGSAYVLDPSTQYNAGFSGFLKTGTDLKELEIDRSDGTVTNLTDLSHTDLFEHFGHAPVAVSDVSDKDGNPFEVKELGALFIPLEDILRNDYDIDAYDFLIVDDAFGNDGSLAVGDFEDASDLVVEIVERAGEKGLLIDPDNNYYWVDTDEEIDLSISYFLSDHTLRHIYDTPNRIYPESAQGTIKITLTGQYGTAQYEAPRAVSGAMSESGVRAI